MNARRYWFPVRPARNGWGWGLPVAWQGWAVLLVFFVVLIGGEIALARHGPLVLSTWGLLMGALLLGVFFWKGEPQSARDERAP